MAGQGRGHHDREDLAGEHRLGDAGQAAFAVLFGAVWGVDSFVLHWTTMLDTYVPDWLRLGLGALLLVIAAILAVISMRTVFGEVRDPPAVIRTGLYARVRHPMYLSELLLYAGLVVLSLSLASIVVLVGALLFLRMICRYEERLLVERFGDAYRDYMRDVPMWIPRLRRKSP